jgi:transposase
MAAATRRLCGLRNGVRRGGVRSRSGEPARSAPAWAASWPLTASGCSRSAGCGGSAARAGKTDALDAVRAAGSVFEQKRPATPRSGGERETLRALMAARAGAVNAKRAGLCQPRDLLITTPEPLRSELRPLSRARLLGRLTATRPERRHDPELRGTLLALRAVARRVQQLTVEERELAREIERLTTKLAPQLLNQHGVGPLLAAQIVLSWSHRGRVVSEAAFARLAGAAPIPASSGQTIRYRLDRSGDRQRNRALHQIVVTRRRTHRPTIDYIERRTREGKSRREATRCPKRYLARNLYRLLETPPLTT